MALSLVQAARRRYRAAITGWARRWRMRVRPARNGRVEPGRRGSRPVGGMSKAGMACRSVAAKVGFAPVARIDQDEARSDRDSPAAATATWPP